MKPFPPAGFIFLLLLALLAAAPAGAHQLTPGSPIAMPLEQITGRIQAKLLAGEESEAAFAPEIADLDALYEKYRDQKTHDTAEILIAKISLYIEFIDDVEKSIELVRQLQEEFSGVDIGMDTEGALTVLTARAQAKAVQDALIGRPAPDLRFRWASREGLRSFAGLKGRVVVLDFWATWSVPCVRAFPQTRALAARYAGHDVEVVAVTSVQGIVSGLEAEPIDTTGDPEREIGLMPAYMKAKDITWTVAFSETERFMADFAIQRIPYRAIVAPDGTVRHVELHPGRETESQMAMIDALLREFGLKAPAP